MGSPGTPSSAAFTTITFIATITALTSGLITQCHPVLDAVLGHHVVLSHPASLAITCPPVRGTGLQTRGHVEEMGLRPPSVTFIIHSLSALPWSLLCLPSASLLCHMPCSLLRLSLSVTLVPTLPGLANDRSLDTVVGRGVLALED